MIKKVLLINISLLFALNTIAQTTKDIDLSKSIVIEKHHKKGFFIKDPEGNTFKVPQTIHAITKLSNGDYVTYDEVDFSYHTYKFYKLKLRNSKFEEKSSVNNLSDYYLDYGYGPGELFSKETNKSYLLLERKVENNYFHNIMDNDGKLVFENDLKNYKGIIGKWISNMNNEGKKIFYSLETGQELILPNEYEIKSYYSKSKLVKLKKVDKEAIFDPNSKKILFETEGEIELLDDNSNLEELYFKTINKEGISKIFHLNGTEILSGNISRISYVINGDDRSFRVVNKDGLTNEFSINQMKYKYPFFYKEMDKKNDLTIFKIDENYIVFKPNNIPFIKEEDGINNYRALAGHILFKKIDRESRKTVKGQLYNRNNKDIAQRDIPVYEDVENLWDIRDTANYMEITFIDRERIVLDKDWNIIYQKGEIPTHGVLYYDSDKKAFRLQIHGIKEHQYFPIK